MILGWDSFFWRWTEDFGVHWYGLAYLCSFVLGALVIRFISRRQDSGLSDEQCWDLILFAAVAIAIGGRLGFCFFYDHDLFFQFRGEFPFWGVLALQQGGMSAFGAMLAIAALLLFLSWRWGISLPHLFDLSAVTGALTFFFLRLASFLSGELLGRPVDGDFPYACKFPQEIFYWLQAGGSNEPHLQALAKVEPSLNLAAPDLGEQILLLVSQGNTKLAEALTAQLAWRYPTQIFAAAGEGFLIFLLLMVLWYSPRRPGVIAGLFFLFYSLSRFVEEVYAAPEWTGGPWILGLTIGQVLAGILFVAGCWFLFFYGRRDLIPRPGWGLGPNVRIHRRP